MKENCLQRVITYRPPSVCALSAFCWDNPSCFKIHTTITHRVVQLHLPSAFWLWFSSQPHFFHRPSALTLTFCSQSWLSPGLDHWTKSPNPNHALHRSWHLQCRISQTILCKCIYVYIRNVGTGIYFHLDEENFCFFSGKRRVLSTRYSVTHVLSPLLQGIPLTCSYHDAKWLQDDKWMCRLSLLKEMDAVLAILLQYAVAYAESTYILLTLSSHYLRR